MAKANHTGVIPSQAHWPTERERVIEAAVREDGGVWPYQLVSGVMFYMGERITRAEFERVSEKMR